MVLSEIYREEIPDLVAGVHVTKRPCMLAPYDFIKTDFNCRTTLPCRVSTHISVEDDLVSLQRKFLCDFMCASCLCCP